MKARSLFLFSFFILSRAFAIEDAVNKLPEDMMMRAQVIHKLRYSWDKTNDFSIKYATLFGDKFLSSNGISLTDTFYFTENFAVRGSFAYFKQVISSEVSTLKAKGIEPFMSDPEWLASLLLVYQPLYGKVIVGGYVQRFKWGGACRSSWSERSRPKHHSIGLWAPIYSRGNGGNRTYFATDQRFLPSSQLGFAFTYESQAP